KEETRKKINKAIKDLNYRPNETARTLYKRKSKMIGLLLPDISNQFFTIVDRGIEDETMAKDYHLILCKDDRNEQTINAYIKNIKFYNFCVIISSQLSTQETFDSFKSYNMPFVLLDRVYADHEFVETNHYKGGQLQAQAVIKGSTKSVLIMQQNLQYKSFNER